MNFHLCIQQPNKKSKYFFSFLEEKKRLLNKTRHKSIKVTCVVTTFSHFFYIQNNKLNHVTKLHENCAYWKSEFSGQVSFGEIPVAE